MFFPKACRRVLIYIAARMVGENQPHQHEGIAHQRAAIRLAVFEDTPAQMRNGAEQLQTTLCNQNPRQARFDLHLSVRAR